MLRSCGGCPYFPMVVEVLGMFSTVGWRGPVEGHGECSVMALSAPFLFYISIESENIVSGFTAPKSSVFVCVCICEFVVCNFRGSSSTPAKGRRRCRQQLALELYEKGLRHCDGGHEVEGKQIWEDSTVIAISKPITDASFADSSPLANATPGGRRRARRSGDDRIRQLATAHEDKLRHVVAAYEAEDAVALPLGCDRG